MTLIGLLLGSRHWWDLLLLVTVVYMMSIRRGDVRLDASPLYPLYQLFGRAFSVTVDEEVLRIAWSHPARNTPAYCSARYCDIVFLWLLSTRFFYATGHANDFGTVAVGAGFVGATDFSYYFSGTLVAIHTFAAELLLCVMLLAMAALTNWYAPSTGELSVQSTFEHRLGQDWLWFLQLHMCRVVASSIMAFVLRRHLMVWAIFAPKYVFDVCKLLAVNTSMFLFRTLSWYLY
jgi:hypothetical protein